MASVKFCLSAGGADSHSVGRASGEESTLPGKTEIHHPIFESRNLNLAGEFDSQFALFSSYLSLFHPTLVWSPVLTKVNNNAASPSYHNMHSDEGAQSSEEGSALRSPAFAPAFSPIHGDNCQLSSHLLRHLTFTHLHYKVRYQPQSSLDVQRAPAGLLQPYDYPVPLNVRPPPLLDDTEELSHSTVPFSSHYLGQMTHRSHFDREFPSPHQLQPRIPQGVPNVSNTVDLRLSSPSEARFAGHDPHEPNPSRLGVGALDPDHVPSLTEDQNSPDNSPTISGLKAPRKEVSNVVIACRQWCVPHHVIHSIARD